VRRDTTVSVLGRVYELEQGFLAGRVVDVVYSYLDDPPRPEVEHEGKRYPLALVDPLANSRRRRPERLPQGGTPSQPVSFDPGCTTRADVSLDEEEALDASF
jgi:putative transposase